MNILDMIIIAVLSFFLIRGIFRGLTRELASIIGVVVGFYGALVFFPRVVKFFPQNLAASPYADILGFTVIFCGIFLVIHLVAMLIRWALGISMLGWVDRLLGAGFGAVKGTLVLGVALFVMTRFLQPPPAFIKESLLCGHVTKATETMAQVVTRELPAIKTKAKALQDKWKN